MQRVEPPPSMLSPLVMLTNVAIPRGGHAANFACNCLGAPVFRDKIGIFVPTEAKIFDV